jgi:hypothetical protein
MGSGHFGFAAEGMLNFVGSLHYEKILIKLGVLHLGGDFEVDVGRAVCES